MQKRFSWWTRLISAACALLVAFFFQVDSVDLLRRLSSDPELRTQLEAVASELLDEEGRLVLKPATIEELCDSALDSVAIVYSQSDRPDLAAKLEQIQTLGKTEEEITNEIIDSLEGETPEVAREVVQSFRNYYEAHHQTKIEDGLATYDEMSGRLAAFNIGLMSGGWEYYRSISNLVGILITTFLLALGAPFWFEQLRRLINLKDALKPERKNKDEEG
jgi:hypothetical protein